MPTGNHDGFAMRGILRTRWFFPSFCLALGAACAGAMWHGGHDGDALAAAALFALIASVFAFGGRSETVRQIRGDGADERWRSIDLAATALSGMAIIVSVIGACLWEWAHGRSGSPYSQLGAIGGFAYIAALLVLRRRG